MKPTAWITGAGGLIGNYLIKTAPAHWRARPIHRQVVDLLEFEMVKSLFKFERPDLIVHCAAISKSPECDANPPLATRVNVQVPARLSALAENIPFIFLSTDLVFDGKKGAYIETDPVNPLSVYAETKARAESVVLQNPKHTVIRTSLNAGHSPTGNRAFNEEMRLAFEAGRTVNLFADEFRCPIPAEITARAIWEIAERPGLFHLCGAERLSRHQIGQLIAANHPELNPKLAQGTLRDYKGSPRSPDTSMDCAKIQKLLSFPLPRFSDWALVQARGSI